MYWYFAGAAVCLIAARNLKRRVSGQKKLYQAVLVFAAGLLLAGAAAVSETGEPQGKISRNEPGQGSQEKEYVIQAEGVLEDYSLKLDIEEKRLTKGQKEEYLNQAKQELDGLLLGENPSKDQVTKPLYLPELLQEGAVEAVYSFSDYDIFNPDGTLAAEPEKPVLVEITAELTCQEETCLYQFYVQAVPGKKSRQEQFAEKVKARIAEENQQEDQSYVNLPQEVDGKKITWKEQGVNQSLTIAFLGTALAGGLLIKEKEEKKRRETAREKQLLLDYPEIVSKLSLLLGAGMNISLAWERIALTYRKKREAKETEPRYAYEEMLHSLYEIQEGMGELQAYENFGERCQLSVYRKLSALIVQNVRKGARGMQRLLEEEEQEAYARRKARARQAGEEAGTKLLLPMGIMLVIVLAILIIPAGMSLDL